MASLRYLCARARTLILIAAGLTAAGSLAPSQAAPLVQFASPDCVAFASGDATSTDASCTGSLVPGLNGSNGIKLTGSAGVDVGASGGVIAFSLTGLANGGWYADALLPLHWEFSIGERLGPTATDLTPLTWIIGFSFNDTPLFTTNGVALPGDTISGSQTVDLTDFGPIGNYSIGLLVGAYTATSFSVTIPSHSIDVNSSAPEPATVLLLAPGIAFLMYRKRRGSKQAS